MKIERALISVFNKNGIIELATALHREGVEILSSGGTAKVLKTADIPVIEVSKYTGSEQMFEGRVKTLHPKIHGGILYRRGNSKDEKEAKKHGIKPIDMVVVNLYPFERVVAEKGVTEEKAIENIDIGGPAMIRAAAKNFPHVTVVVDPEDYHKVIQEMETHNGMVSEKLRRNLMIKAFERTSHYDWAISKYFGGEGLERFPHRMKGIFERAYPLRYGENPHQRAAAYRQVGHLSLFDAKIFSGKQMSYNNFLDADSALHLIREFHGKTACVILKHTNPCGGAIGRTLKEAYERAHAGDPLAAFGGIIAVSQRMDIETAHAIGDKFIEIIMAPGYDPDALEVLKSKKSRRILDISPLFQPMRPGDVNFRNITGGMLYQEEDANIYNENELKVVTKKKPTQEQLKGLRFGMIFAKHTKSNAVIICKEGQLVGVGAGQMSRVDSCKIAISKAKQNKFELEGCVSASDAFIPFPDTVECLGKEGIGAIIQPGGSIRDREVAQCADKYDMAMVFSKFRHFKH